MLVPLGQVSVISNCRSKYTTPGSRSATEQPLAAFGSQPDPLESGFNKTVEQPGLSNSNACRSHSDQK